MNIVLITLVAILIVLSLIVLLIIFIIKKGKYFLQTYFDSSNLNEAIENSKLKEEETQKSISSMESIYRDKIMNDFPNLNLNELKSMAESNIYNVLDTIEKKDMNLLKNKNERISSFVQNKIDDLKDVDVNIDNIKIHKTALSKYDITDSIANIEIGTSLEYIYKEGSKESKKIQTRFKQEFIYIIDSSKVAKSSKVLGINCPNCGAPVKNIGKKYCTYCNSGIEDIVKRVWVINNIKEY